ncbi:MAG: DNA repair protein RecO [Limnohabitans sp.]|nr:DNA repair protein RecO [Limnohabitans sp.]
MPNLIDEAICIRQWDWSETSQTVSLFCRSTGILRGLAKGARRERGSFSGGIDLLARGEIVAVVKPDRELQTLTQWTLLQLFRRPHDELETNLVALSMAELVHRFLPPSVPHERLFDALTTTLERLEEGERPAPEFLRFFLVFLREVGHVPRFDADGIPSSRLAFDPTAGGVVDVGEHPHAWRMRAETLTALALVSRGEPPENCDPDAVDRANRLLAAYAREILGSDLVTIRLATEPRKIRAAQSA